MTDQDEDQIEAMMEEVRRRVYPFGWRAIAGSWGDREAEAHSWAFPLRCLRENGSLATVVIKLKKTDAAEVSAPEAIVQACVRYLQAKQFADIGYSARSVVEFTIAVNVPPAR